MNAVLQYMPAQSKLRAPPKPRGVLVLVDQVPRAGDKKFFWVQQLTDGIDLSHGVCEELSPFGASGKKKACRGAPRVSELLLMSIVGGIAMVNAGSALVVRNQHPIRDVSLETMFSMFYNNDFRPHLLPPRGVLRLKHGDLIVITDPFALMNGNVFQGEVPFRVVLFLEEEIEAVKRKVQNRTRMEGFRVNFEAFLKCVQYLTTPSPFFVLSTKDNDARLHDTRAVTLSMGNHPRLGAQSIIRCLNRDTLRAVAAFLW